MSKRRNRVVNEVKDDQVIEGEIVEETEEETSEVAEEKTEKKPSKARAIAKKAIPFVIGAGAVLAAFLVGRSSGNDEMALAALEAEYGDEENSEDSDDESTDESKTSTEE